MKARHRLDTVDIITMGCSKNLVDSERLIKMFERAGFEVRHNPDDVNARFIIVNTCGFIGDAKEESIEMILRCCQFKKHRRGVKVYVMGCLSQRYAQELPVDIPEVDGWYGKFDWVRMLGELNDERTKPWERTLTTPEHSAYLKIAEGCNRFCAFCAIPLITGRYQSRPIEEILEEVRALVAKGVKEFNVIAQDLSYYGIDLYGEHRIAQLVEQMALIEGVKWIRLHYAYPADFPYDLLPVMAKYPNVCKYLDIALQHISDPVLKNMRRHITGAETRALLKRIRAEVPGIAIRTTLMVGFPGEGEKEFEELLDFVREQRFERMGAFAYCEEDDTYAAKNFADDIPEDVKRQRLDKLMALQEEISAELNQAMVGKVVPVLIESHNIEEGTYTGRTQYDSPEVDQEVIIPVAYDPNMLMPKIGEIYDVEITDAMPFDLVGKLVDNRLFI